MKARRISRQKPSRTPLTVHYRPFLGSISSLKDSAELITDYMSVIYIESQFARNCRVLQRNLCIDTTPFCHHGVKVAQCYRKTKVSETQRIQFQLIGKPSGLFREARGLERVRRDALLTVGKPSRLAPGKPAGSRGKAGRLTYGQKRVSQQLLTDHTSD
jgi:hypothetical protein